jgi:hypothetical protein
VIIAQLEEIANETCSVESASRRCAGERMALGGAGAQTARHRIGATGNDGSDPCPKDFNGFCQPARIVARIYEPELDHRTH